eukprot:CAMPEP_0184304000 /NCGR_PEP_ID=MMETSP1049-20130417/13635_1 /TAXON_ID=77928 /ORGANISM="Proteomonas sulcata, Strain CCMP704" /LENGTH=351 /DNA_ID=CAMNT_0026615715 /DNA_START=458 /DNA_END=1513 /DNA_ORIENTATION=+
MTTSFLRNPGAVSSLAATLPLCSSLTKLDLSSNGLGAASGQRTDPDAVVAVLAEALKKTRGLRSLNLSHNNGLGAHIAPSIWFLVSLTHLDLSKTGIDNQGAKELASALSGLSSLESLILGDNKIQTEGALELCDMLPRLSRLRVLNLGNSEAAVNDPDLGNDMHLSGARRLAQILPTLTHLEELDVAGNRICDLGAVRISEALFQCPRLRRLNLSRNVILLDGVSALCASLPRCSSLVHLQMCATGLGTGLGDEMTRRLATILPRCRALKKLELADNGMDAAGATHLAEVLPSCQNLRYLGLQSNPRIGEAGAARFGGLESLRLNVTIDLRSCFLGSEVFHTLGGLGFRV